MLINLDIDRLVDSEWSFLGRNRIPILYVAVDWETRSFPGVSSVLNMSERRVFLL